MSQSALVAPIAQSIPTQTGINAPPRPRVSWPIVSLPTDVSVKRVSYEKTLSVPASDFKSPTSSVRVRLFDRVPLEKGSKGSVCGMQVTCMARYPKPLSANPVQFKVTMGYETQDVSDVNYNDYQAAMVHMFNEPMDPELGS